ncbi:MAG: exosortase/archaeosortase family protein [Candidatus Bathyarchaeia archaeon]
MDKSLKLKISIIALAILTQIPYMLPSITSSLPKINQMLNQPIYGWAALSSCLLWFIVKYKPIINALEANRSLIASHKHLTAGLTISTAALITELLSPKADVFYAAALSLLFISGVFIALGSLTPVMISIAYIAGIGTPEIINAIAYKALSESAAATMAWTLNILGHTAHAQGAFIRIQTVNGGFINAYIDPVCAGSTSLSIFICLFTLITMDLNPKPMWKIAAFLIAGCVGTMAQAMLRLTLMGVIGASYGLEAFLTAHKYLGYILFTIYFLSFTYIYMKSASKPIREAAGEARNARR